MSSRFQTDDFQDPGIAAVVWTSIDGITWSRIPHQEPVFGGIGDQEMMSVIAGDPGLVAIGSDWARDEVDAAVWRSPDGVTWSRIRIE